MRGLTFPREKAAIINRIIVPHFSFQSVRRRLPAYTRTEILAVVWKPIDRSSDQEYDVTSGVVRRGASARTLDAYARSNDESNPYRSSEEKQDNVWDDVTDERMKRLGAITENTTY